MVISFKFQINLNYLINFIKSYYFPKSKIFINIYLYISFMFNYLYYCTDNLNFPFSIAFDVYCRPTKQ